MPLWEAIQVLYFFAYAISYRQRIALKRQKYLEESLIARSTREYTFYRLDWVNL